MGGGVWGGVWGGGGTVVRAGYALIPRAPLPLLLAASQDTINQRMRTAFRAEFEKWGVMVERIELQDLRPKVRVWGGRRSGASRWSASSCRTCGPRCARPAL